MEPERTREIHNHHFDSSRWDKFNFKDDDIVIATAYKSGTTWMQNIVAQLTFQGKTIPDDIDHFTPWLDLRCMPPMDVFAPILDSCPYRRSVKTHLCLDALRFNPEVKYIYVGRDGRDCYMSLINHYRTGTDIWYHALNDTPGRVGDPLPRFNEEEHSETKLMQTWLTKGAAEGETDGYPFWSWFDNVASWWKYRHLPNILFVNFCDLKKDLAGCVKEIAAFLEIPLPDENLPAIVQALTFESMKNAGTAKVMPPAVMFAEGNQSFLNKGVNGRWKDVLTAEQLAAYDMKVKEKLTPECAIWMEHGNAGFHPKSGI